MTIILVKPLATCPICGGLVRIYEDRPANRRVVRDATEFLDPHVCEVQDNNEEIDKITACPKCGEINCFVSTWGRFCEWYFPYPVPPFLDHVCIPERDRGRVVNFPSVERILAKLKRPKPIWEAYES